MSESTKSQAIFTDDYVLVNGKKILYSELNDDHILIKDKFSFRLGVLAGSAASRNNHAKNTHKTQ